MQISAPTHNDPQGRKPRIAEGIPTSLEQTLPTTAAITTPDANTTLQGQMTTSQPSGTIDLAMTDSEEDTSHKTSGQYDEGDPCEHRLCTSPASETCLDCSASLCATHGQSSPCHSHNYMAQCLCPMCNQPPGLQGSRPLNDNDATPALEQWTEDSLLQTEDPLTLIFHEVQKKGLCGKHVLNNLLQRRAWTEEFLQEIRAELDSVTPCRHGNADGWFSSEVLHNACSLAGLDMGRWTTGAPIPLKRIGIGLIVHDDSREHWFCLRKDKKVFWLHDSLHTSPRQIPNIQGMWSELRKNFYTVWSITGPVTQIDEEEQVRNVEYWRTTLRDFQEREDSELAARINEAEISKAIWLQERSLNTADSPTPQNGGPHYLPPR